MQTESHNKLGQPHVGTCTRLLVRDDFGNPVALLMEAVSGQVWIHRRGEPTFETVLRNMGIKDTIVETHNLDTRGFPKPPGKLWQPGDVTP